MSRTALRRPRKRRRTEAQQRYSLLLRDPRWRRLRQYVLVRDGRRCRRCGARQGLHVHHRTYAPSGLPWDVPLTQLTTLCRGCHRRAHGKGKERFPKA